MKKPGSMAMRFITPWSKARGTIKKIGIVLFDGIMSRFLKFLTFLLLFVREILHFVKI